MRFRPYYFTSKGAPLGNLRQRLAAPMPPRSLFTSSGVNSSANSLGIPCGRLHSFCSASRQSVYQLRKSQRASGPMASAPRAPTSALTVPAIASGSGRDTATLLQQVTGLSELAGRYKALLLDQFGVLHDGRRPYPGAVEAVAAAAARGVRLLIISNSSRRAGGTLDKLAAMGFDRGCFEGVVTSGEMTHRYLTTRPDAWWAGLGTRCVHVNWSKRGPASLEGYGLQVVTDPRDADFILAHGTEALSLPGGGVEERPLQALKQLLVEAAADGSRPPPPLVVANPDVVTVDGDELVAMPGSLAAAYSAAGGPVVLMGKPAPLIYSACGELLGLARGELLAVGDSLEHDIAGAAAAGIDSLFIAGGIHARELLPLPQQPGSAAGQQVDLGALRQLVSQHLGEGAGAPTYVAPRFVW